MEQILKIWKRNYIMENVSFRICSFLSDEWISTEIGMSLPVNLQFDTGTAEAAHDIKRQGIVGYAWC